MACHHATKTFALEHEIAESARKWATGLSDQELEEALAKLRRRHQLVEMQAERMERSQPRSSS